MRLRAAATADRAVVGVAPDLADVGSAVTADSLATRNAAAFSPAACGDQDAFAQRVAALSYVRGAPAAVAFTWAWVDSRVSAPIEAAFIRRSLAAD
jgi:hypothetical protein